MSSLVSIIITTRNEATVLEKLLQSLKDQSYKKIEIIVVDNNSSDNTLLIAKKYTQKTYTFGPERSAQRNYGVQKAKGEYFLFLDADMELSTEVVAQCVNQIKSKRKFGEIIIPEVSIARSFWEKVKAFERSFYNAEGDTITDAARFYKKEVFLKAKGFDESITGPEDWDLSERVKKLNYMVARISAVIYHHERIISPINLARKKFYYGLKAYRYLQKNKVSVLSPKTVYFLRPVFYRQWKRLMKHPVLTLGMIYLLSCETVGGGLGYLLGRYKRL